MSAQQIAGGGSTPGGGSETRGALPPGFITDLDEDPPSIPVFMWEQVRGCRLCAAGLCLYVAGLLACGSCWIDGASRAIGIAAAAFIGVSHVLILVHQNRHVAPGLPAVLDERNATARAADWRDSTWQSRERPGEGLTRGHFRWGADGIEFLYGRVYTWDWVELAGINAVVFLLVWGVARQAGSSAVMLSIVTMTALPTRSLPRRIGSCGFVPWAKVRSGCVGRNDFKLELPDGTLSFTLKWSARDVAISTLRERMGAHFTELTPVEHRRSAPPPIPRPQLPPTIAQLDAALQRVRGSDPRPM